MKRRKYIFPNSFRYNINVRHLSSKIDIRQQTLEVIWKIFSDTPNKPIKTNEPQSKDRGSFFKSPSDYLANMSLMPPNEPSILVAS